MDVVCAVGLAGVAYQEYYGPELVVPNSAAELEALRQRHGTVSLLYSFTRDMRLRYPELFDYVRRDFSTVEIFPGTLDDGNIHLTRARRVRSQERRGGNCQVNGGPRQLADGIPVSTPPLSTQDHQPCRLVGKQRPGPWHWEHFLIEG